MSEPVDPTDLVPAEPLPPSAPPFDAFAPYDSASVLTIISALRRSVTPERISVALGLPIERAQHACRRLLAAGVVRQDETPDVVAYTLATLIVLAKHTPEPEVDARPALDVNALAREWGLVTARETTAAEVRIGPKGTASAQINVQSAGWLRTVRGTSRPTPFAPCAIDLVRIAGLPLHGAIPQSALGIVELPPGTSNVVAPGHQIAVDLRNPDADHAGYVTMTFEIDEIDPQFTAWIWSQNMLAMAAGQRVDLTRASFDAFVEAQTQTQTQAVDFGSTKVPAGGEAALTYTAPADIEITQPMASWSFPVGMQIDVDGVAPDFTDAHWQAVRAGQTVRVQCKNDGEFDSMVYASCWVRKPSAAAVDASPTT